MIVHIIFLLLPHQQKKKKKKKKKKKREIIFLFIMAADNEALNEELLQEDFELEDEGQTESHHVAEANDSQDGNTKVRRMKIVKHEKKESGFGCTQ